MDERYNQQHGLNPQSKSVIPSMDPELDRRDLIYTYMELAADSMFDSRGMTDSAQEDTRSEMLQYFHHPNSKPCQPVLHVHAQRGSPEHSFTVFSPIPMFPPGAMMRAPESVFVTCLRQ